MSRTTIQVERDVSENLDSLVPHMAKRLNLKSLTKKQAVEVLVNEEMKELGVKPKKKEAVA
jgi:hypothetical protein